MNPRSYTADETSGPDETDPITPVALLCGHEIDLDTALDLDPGETVWCPPCGCDQPVASVEFLEAHDADPILVGRAVYVEGVAAARRLRQCGICGAQVVDLPLHLTIHPKPWPASMTVA